MSAALAAAAPLDFALPDRLAAAEPPEARGLGRDEVRLLVSGDGGDSIAHGRFGDLPEHLAPGDLLVVNASATINAALDAWRDAAGGGEHVVLHLSSTLPGGGPRDWIVELRRPSGAGTVPLLDARPGERVRLLGGVRATLLRPVGGAAPDEGTRLWAADVAVPGGASGGVLAFAARHGRPIRYGYVPEPWPLSYYQTIFAVEPGSAEMPSAGRAFTPAVVERLARRGVRIAPLVLHTGVASLETGEGPYPERYRVSPATADAVNRARDAGHRVVAVGTTVVRALETVADRDGRVRAGAGWTDLVITPERGVRAVDALLTGFHAPRASHLAMLEAVAGRAHLAAAYAAALVEEYRWHEFGDVHLILRT